MKRLLHFAFASVLLQAVSSSAQTADIIIHNGKVLTVDEASLIAEADKVGRRIWSQVQAAGPIEVPRLPRPKE